MAGSILEVRDLKVTFEGRDESLPVLETISFDVITGSTLGIAGESGSGKTLLCKSLIGLVPDDAKVSGTIMFRTPDAEEFDIHSMPTNELGQIRGKMIGFLFQEPASSMNPVRKCGQQVFDALPSSLQTQKAAGRHRVTELLELVGLSHPEKVAKSYPHELSGGMLQRVVLAAAIAGEPSVLIADEPTTALDAPARLEILETLEQLKNELGLTLILVSHDISLMSDWTDDMLILYSGRIVEYGKTEKLISSPSHPYTQALLETEQSFEEEGLPKAIPGELPSMANPPSGCRFHPRCRYADDQCKGEEPSMFSATHGGETRCYYPLEH